MDDALRQAPLFAALDEAGAEALRATMIEVGLSKGEVLFAEGEPGDRLYVILDGKVPHAVLLELLTEHGAGTLITG